MSIIKGHPVNLPRSTKYGSDYIFFYSLKNRREVHAESQLEHAAFTFFEVCPSIKAYTEHPGTESIYDEEGKVVTTIFDALLEFTDDSLALVEIKYESDLNGDSESATRAEKQIRAQYQIAREKDIKYFVITDKMLFGPKAKANNELFMYRRLWEIKTNVVKEQAKPILDTIIKEGEMTLMDLLPEVDSYSTLLDIVTYLHVTGKAVMDIDDTEICYQTKIRAERRKLDAKKQRNLLV